MIAGPSTRAPRRTTRAAVLQYLLLVLALIAGPLLVSCGGDDECAGACECSGLACVCPSSGDCFVRCIADCDLQCAGSGSCDFECGADCAVGCTGSGACVVTVGDASSVSCPGSGGCDVVCVGDCAVDCPGSGECIVECAIGAECLLERCEAAQSCPDGVQVCNGPCP
jgi:hypothetical protein